MRISGEEDHRSRTIMKTPIKVNLSNGYGTTLAGATRDQTQASKQFETGLGGSSLKSQGVKNFLDKLSARKTTEQSQIPLTRCVGFDLPDQQSSFSLKTKDVPKIVVGNARKTTTMRS